MNAGYYDIPHKATVSLLLNDRDKIAMITEVAVDKSLQGNGYGSQLMERVLRDADDEGWALMLSVEPYGGSMSATQLRDWYYRLGFVDKTENTMVRIPEGKTQDDFTYFGLLED